MNKKSLLALWVLLLSIKTCLHASEAADSSDKHNKSANAVITHSKKAKNFVNMDFTNKPLPKDLSGANLTNANLTGHHFTNTNFTNARLTGVMLTNTTCDYQQCFLDNLHPKQFYTGIWFLKNLPKDFKSIAKIYPNILKDSQKAALLEIASNLAYLPAYKDMEFYIKVEYWSCKLWLLRNQFGAIGTKVVFSLDNHLLTCAQNYCWATDYPVHLENLKAMKIANQWCISITTIPLPGELGTLIQHYLITPVETLHADFNRYLQLFRKGLKNYNTESKHIAGHTYFKKTIIENLQGLYNVYPELTSPKHQKEAMTIACQLSQSYKKQGWQLLFHFLDCQSQLINFKISLDIACKHHIYYNNLMR